MSCRGKIPKNVGVHSPEESAADDSNPQCVHMIFPKAHEGRRSRGPPSPPLIYYFDFISSMTLLKISSVFERSSLLCAAETVKSVWK